MLIVYYMVAYKSNMMHVEYYTLNFFPIRHNRNAYPREDNNGSDDSSTFMLDNRHSRETIIPENIYLSKKKIIESRDSVPPSTHIDVQNTGSSH